MSLVWTGVGFVVVAVVQNCTVKAEVVVANIVD